MTSSASLGKLGVDGGMTSKDILAKWAMRYIGPEAAALMHKVTIGHGRYDYLPRQYDNCEDICIGE